MSDPKPAPKPKRQSKAALAAADDMVISLQAQVEKVSTTVDGGWSVTLTGSGQHESVSKFFKVAKQPGIVVEVVAVAIDTSKENEPKENKEFY